METTHSLDGDPGQYVPVTRYLVVSGGPVDGFIFQGPFLDRDEAVEFAGTQAWDAAWWIAPMEGPL